MQPCRSALLAVVAIAATAGVVSAVVYTPHLVARVQTKAGQRKQGTGKRVAVISALYEVDTQDWEGMKLRAAERLAAGLEGIDPAYLEVERTDAIVVGTRCLRNVAMRCTAAGGAGMALRAPGVGGAGPDGDLSGTDPRHCRGIIASNPAVYEQYLPTPFVAPTITDNAQLERYAFRTPVCVSPRNTSLYQTYYVTFNNVYITGWRDVKNTYVTFKPSEGIRFELHVVGRIPVKWAQYLNVKFVLNGSIPMPLYQPEIVDESAYYTDRLNITIQILGLRQGNAKDPDAMVTRVPVCVQPRIRMQGCFRLDQALYDHPRMPEYKLRSYLVWRKHLLVKVASAQPWLLGDFNISEGPWPVFRWLVTPEVPAGPWRQWTFPQKESVQYDDCVEGNNCSAIPLSPSLRHLHTAVLFRTWNFEKHARKYLCDERPECGSDCLTNLTCLDGPAKYFDQNFFFRSSQFRSDDGGVVPKRGLDDMDCPDQCCADRRLCLRVTDVMGYEIPFDADYMLVFGGKTYAHQKDANGRLVYHDCERIPLSERKDEWRGCTESVVGDLWRYDISRGKWEYIKPESAIDPTTLTPVGYPVPRFGHGAAIVEEIDEKDSASKKIFMYIYGGAGPLCQGVCSDVWRYEVSWASQAYYPKFPDGDWKRGNTWERLKDCPYGGLYRHGMVVTSGQEYIYVYGGQVLGGFRSHLFRYRVSTDMWEDMNPYGRVSLTRLMYDIYGAPRVREVPTKEYDVESDVDCSAAWRFDGRWAHCTACPRCGLRTVHRGKAAGADFPEERGDFAMTSFIDTTPEAIDDILVISGGFRTTWGALSDFQCHTTTTTTGKPMRAPGDVVLTTAAPYTTPLVTTTTIDRSGVAIAGTFPNVRPASVPTAGAAGTTTTPSMRRLQDSSLLVGPGTCEAKYYFDDLWVFDPSSTQWVRRETSGELPTARKGHSIIARRSRTNDTQLMMFGGHNQDQSMKDIWLLDVMRGREERAWTRIDPYLVGVQPPSMSYHSMVYSEDLNLVVVFGGLHWRQTNLTESDRVRNIDRRCFKEAQGLPQNHRDADEAVFVNRMKQLCNIAAFCCVLTQQGGIPDSIDGIATRNSTGDLDLLAISAICRGDCERKAFFPEFYPIMVEGVWGFKTDVCLHGCSGNGYCDMGFCVCRPPWYGRDCSQRRCPGSTCYTHPRSTEQYCVECSQHGRCIHGDCVCFPGWGYADCSTALCEANCSSTPTAAHGICVEDFPTSQCHCFGQWSGPNCSELLCLNGCSRHGQCVGGLCQCDAGYHGADCSLFFLSL